MDGDENVTATMPTSTLNPKTISLIKILAGSLGAMVIITLVLAIVIVVVVIWGLKMRQRRRVQRDLVLRTKHDIFEGVSNAMSCETAGDGSVPMHNVIDSSSPEHVGASYEGSDGNDQFASHSTEVTLS